MGRWNALPYAVDTTFKSRLTSKLCLTIAKNVLYIIPVVKPNIECVHEEYYALYFKSGCDVLLFNTRVLLHFSQIAGGKPLTVEVAGVEYMNDDPAMMDVLYAKVHMKDGSDRWVPHVAFYHSFSMCRGSSSGVPEKTRCRLKLVGAAGGPWASSQEDEVILAS